MPAAAPQAKQAHTPTPVAAQITCIDSARQYYDPTGTDAHVYLCLGDAMQTLRSHASLVAALREIACEVDGREDITDDGSPNLAMRIGSIASAALAAAGAA